MTFSGRGSAMLLVLQLVFLLGLPLSVHGGFGISPPFITEEHLAPGISLKKTIYLVQGDPQNDVAIEVAVESRDGIQDWISFSPGTAFIIPKGIQQFPLEVTIRVPQDADLGVYTAAIRVNTNPALAEGAGTVAVSVGGLVVVDFTVGDEVFASYGIKSINILDIKEREDIKVSMRVANTGNVPAGPADATFELFDKFNSVRLGFVNARSEDLPKIAPFSEEAMVLSFPAGIYLAPGEYWGHVKVFDDKGAIVSNFEKVFNVKERTVWDTLQFPIMTIGALAVLFVLGLFVTRVRRRMGTRRTH